MCAIGAQRGGLEAQSPGLQGFFSVLVFQAVVLRECSQKCLHFGDMESDRPRLPSHPVHPRGRTGGAKVRSHVGRVVGGAAWYVLVLACLLPPRLPHISQRRTVRAVREVGRRKCSAVLAQSFPSPPHLHPLTCPNPTPVGGGPRWRVMAQPGLDERLVLTCRSARRSQPIPASRHLWPATVGRLQCAAGGGNAGGLFRRPAQPVALRPHPLVRRAARAGGGEVF